MSDDLGKCIARDSALLSSLGWEAYVHSRRGRGDFANMATLNHPARRLLRKLQSSGAPVALSSKPWTPSRLHQALQRGPHKSANEHIDFLRDEMLEMVKRA